MSNESEVVALFIPPLAELLAHAEQIKGAPLTEVEASRIRDQAACITMDKPDADKMFESRGYRDVNPENCWADWHRLRVEMTGDGCLPRIVFCLVGNDDLKEQCMPILEQTEVEFEFQDADDRMVEAFKASATSASSKLDDADYQRIALHTTVLYILSDNFSADEAPPVSQAFLHFGCSLLKAGAVAMKCESSGVAHPRTHWLGLAAQCNGNEQTSEYWHALFGAYVGYPIYSGADFYTCGMHLLGAPDLIVSESALKNSTETVPPPQSASYLFKSFGLYLLDECANREFISGHTFRPDEAWPRMRVLWQECSGYEEDDFFFNPFGRWRLEGM